MDPVAVQFTRDFYARVTASLSGAPDFHDLSGFYDASEEAVFFESAHTSPTAGVPIGEEIAKRILDARTAGRPPSQR